MSLTIKFAGIILLVLTSTGIGFIRSLGLTLREKELTRYIAGITELKERIFFEGIEIERLIGSVFPDGDVKIIGGKPQTESKSLVKEDISVLEEFFSRLGTTERQGEVSRAELCLTLLEKQRQSAHRDIEEKSRLYKALGFSIGLFGAIFLI